MVLEFEIDNYIIKVGKNAQENWDIIKEANKNDIWFHLEDYPSPHVVLKSINNIKPDRKIKKQAALKCKEKSKYKSYSKISIIYTKIKNIKLGDKIGEVITSKTSKFII